MTSRRSTHLAIVLAAAVALAVLVLARPPGDTRLWAASCNAAHAPWFAGVTWGLSRLLRPEERATRAGRWRAMAALAAMALGLAVLTEGIQAWTGGDAEAGDVLRDAIGAAAALLVSVGRFPASEGRRRLARRGGPALLVLSFAPLVLLLADYAARDRAFPVIFDPAAAWQRGFVELEATDWSIHGVALGDDRLVMAHLTFHPAPYPGLVVDEPFPDWRGYDRLRLSVRSELEHSVQLTLRIDDRRHDWQYTDRFNRALEIRPGSNSISISLDEVRLAPHGREMDMTGIRRLLLFAVSPQRSFALDVGPFRLERSGTAGGAAAHLPLAPAGPKPVDPRERLR